MKKTYLNKKSTLKRSVGTLSKSKRKVSPQGNSAPRRTISKPKKKAWKFKKTELSECDSAFSKEIIARDGHCLYPGCFSENNLTCSHYIGRGNWNTRFDPVNCIVLCRFHHYESQELGLENKKQRVEQNGFDGAYTVLMKNLLSGEAWYELLDRAKGSKSRKEAIQSYNDKTSI